MGAGVRREVDGVPQARRALGRSGGWPGEGVFELRVLRGGRGEGRRGACRGPVLGVEDGHGGFLTRLDVEQFTETVRRLLLDPELRREQSCKAREHANRFSLDVMTESLLRVYESLADVKRTT